MADRRCPAYADGVCHREHAQDGAAHCRTFRCTSCRRSVPWCFGGSSDERCDDCFVRDVMHDPRAYVS